LARKTKIRYDLFLKVTTEKSENTPEKKLIETNKLIS
jgi:hypothetical protein